MAKRAVTIEEDRKFSIAYYLLMHYAATSVGRLTEAKTKVSKLAGNREVRAEHPHLTIESLTSFVAKLFQNAALRAMGSDEGSFNNLDSCIAYTILKYVVASKNKKLYDLVRDLGRIRSELKEVLAVEIDESEFREFAALMYGDTVRFVFQGQN